MRKIYSVNDLKKYCEDILDCIVEATEKGRTGVVEPQGAHILSTSQLCRDLAHIHPDCEKTRRVVSFLTAKGVLRRGDNEDNVAVINCSEENSFKFMRGHPREGQTCNTRKLYELTSTDWKEFSRDSRLEIIWKEWICPLWPLKR